MVTGTPPLAARRFKNGRTVLNGKSVVVSICSRVTLTASATVVVRRFLAAHGHPFTLAGGNP